MNGFLVIDKPSGMTSRGAIDRVKRSLPRHAKIGHTGTLDPLATGVLVVCVGKATRLADLVQAMPKTYLARFQLGATSTTDDADGEITESSGTIPDEATVRAELETMTGTIFQIPPNYSAVKVEGRRAHKLARKGRELDLTPRPVRIDAIRMLAWNAPFCDVEIDCGKGTYIRAIARDLGERLACGGLVAALRRTRVGPYRADVALPPETTIADVRSHLVPMRTATESWPRVTLKEDAAKRFHDGMAIPVPETQLYALGTLLAVHSSEGELTAIGCVMEGGILKPEVVLMRTLRP